MCVRFVTTLLLLLALLGLGTVAAQEDTKAKIARLEKELAAKKEFDFGLHNELRHLYSGIDVKRSLAHCDAIFRHDPTNEYTLDCIGARNADKARAKAALLSVAEKNPELVALGASCRLKAAELSTDPAERKSLLKQVADAKGTGLYKHKALAGARLTAADRPKTAAPWTIPVLVINYFPLTADKTKTDIAVTSNVGAPVKEIEAKCKKQTQEVVEALEEGSRFRPYSNEKAKPSLKYTVVDTITYYEAVPRHSKKKNYTDYNAVMDRVKIREWVEEKGVREVWIWGYHSKEIAPVESNMASVHGNVSNSHRDPFDLPVLKHTYTVYHYNYERGTDMAVHNHLHQIEAVMRHHGGELWQTFEGKPGAWRNGNCHFPVNGVKDYDYANKRYVESDIEDWKPEGFGKKQKMNCDRWAGSDLKWYVYWMNAIPGIDNKLTYKNRPLGNWWEFIGDYDQAVTRKTKLTD
jgi:hypothetical protein